MVEPGTAFARLTSAVAGHPWTLGLEEKTAGDTSDVVMAAYQTTRWPPAEDPAGRRARMQHEERAGESR
jgi:hypothetical protein